MNSYDSRKYLAKWLVALPPLAKLIIASSVDFIALLAVAICSVQLVVLNLSLPVADVGGEGFLYVAPLASITFLYLLGAYRAIVRFFSLNYLLRVLLAMLASGILIFAIDRVAEFAGVLGVTIALYLTGGATALVLIRGVASYFLRPAQWNGHKADRVIIYGAGQAGTQLAAGLAVSGRFQPVAFADDRKDLHGRTLLGLTITAPSHLARLKEEHRFDRILLAIPSLTRARRRQLLERLEPLSAKVMVVPDLDEIASGARKLDELRDVQIEDLLGRDAVAPIEQLLDQDIRGKNVLVTGAGGSIGAELCRQALGRKARKLVLVDVSEYALYSIHLELEEKARQLGCELAPVLGNVLDQDQLRATLARHEIDTVYHAAAYKHVPLVEQNSLVAINNNVFGTQATVQAAIDAGVRNFVLISTDKAVRPTSVMGATKRICEQIIQAQSVRHNRMRMSVVRFGNVLASSGSVVPLFKEQIKRGGPITVTHPDITRYFMTINEAAQLVIQAGAMGGAGDVFVLDMGQPVRILDLAERMIRLSGLEIRSPTTPDGDVAIEFTGLRPGEKLYEELLIGNQPQATSHPRIYKATESALPWSQVNRTLDVLRAAVNTDNQESAVRGLREGVPEFRAELDGVPPVKLQKSEGRDVNLRLVSESSRHLLSETSSAAKFLN